ncbi:TolA, Membrane protein involved in colicin uptake [Pyrenophora tritici-repentis]|uniref:TolA, Membrane protein involved in colicin uptake n=1 Tax=Pyrenophora tritici-repentis TaxID=45151 RepID=A0A834S049_9PLEO|nr:TolA, Membrane protein involved in colicin uptake [Pyrenophora tritici-repentis]
MFKVDRTTLSRRHRGVQRSNAAYNEQKLLLSPQQEDELVKYTERCTRRGLPPTREMIQNFAGTVVKWEVSESWVTRFLHRHTDDLTIKWSAGIDRNRHQADSEERYKLYFDMLHSKMREHNVEARNTYNMDEKGFFVGITSRSKRVFSKAVWASKERTAAVQDGNREWITLLACVCASGDALPPALIYQGTSGLQSGWVDAVEVGKHEVFFSNSGSGWSNNDIGLAWLEQVFQRCTKQKAGRSYRLLILDGHGSHPLDVVLFAPLSKYYSQELDRHLQRSQALLRVTKRDFFSFFWPAWGSTMTQDNILKSFQATGVWPMDAEVILKRFYNTNSEQDEASRLGQHGDGDSWRELRKVFDAAVDNKARLEARRLEASLHSLQVQNELLHYENDGLLQAAKGQKKHKTKSKTMDLQRRKEYHGGAVFWSPRKLREARAREATKRHEAEREQLQKTHDRELKAAAKLYQKRQAEAAKVAQQHAAEERKMAKKAKAEELAAARALKKLQRDAATAQKSHDTSNTPKRKASHKAGNNTAKRRRVSRRGNGAVPAPATPPAPPKKTTRGRQIKTPTRFN